MDTPEKAHCLGTFVHTKSDAQLINPLACYEQTLVLDVCVRHMDARLQITSGLHKLFVPGRCQVLSMVGPCDRPFRNICGPVHPALFRQTTPQTMPYVGSWRLSWWAVHSRMRLQSS